MICLKKGCLSTLTVDTSFKGNGKKVKGKYNRVGTRKGNIFHFVLGKIDGSLICRNRVIHIEPDVFLKCELWKYTWNIDQGITNSYAATKKGKDVIYMHRLIKNCLYDEESIVDMEIDHIEHDGLDNRVGKIRTVIAQENNDNKDTVRGIVWNEGTGSYHLEESLIGQNPSYFKLFHIKFDMERPEPMEDFLEFQNNVIEYKEKLDTANSKLEEHFQRHFKDNFNKL